MHIMGEGGSMSTCNEKDERNPEQESEAGVRDALLATGASDDKSDYTGGHPQQAPDIIADGNTTVDFSHYNPQLAAPGSGSKPPTKIHSLEVDTEGSEADGDARANWGGKLEFLFTCIGYAVGLGNVWRFPYLCYKNGGGAFLLPYILMLVFVGLPLFYIELCFGQFASLGPIAIWKINPLFKGLGYAMVSVSWLIGVYYNVIISHVMLYLFASFAAIPTGLPWVGCNNTWNTPLCLEPEEMEANIANATHLGNNSLSENFTAVVNTTNHILAASRKTPAEEYYNNFVLEMSSGMDEFGGVNWKLALCLFLAWIIVLICLIKGIQSLGKVVYFTALFPYLMLTILLIRGLTLPGAVDGIIFYLKPDFSRLADSRVWSDAATQIFYSLSACSGGLIAMASYNKFDNNCYKDALIVAFINCATSVYAGFVIFTILGFMAMEKGVSVAEVAAGGPGLAFVVYPEALSRMPAPQLWAICFFFMMATLGFGSQFSIVECVLSALSDEFAHYLRGKWQSILFRSSVILATFLLGLPMVCKGGIYLLNLVDYSVSGFPLLFVGLFELAALNWIYGFDKLSNDIELMLGIRPNIFWKVCWMVLSPLIILITIVFNCAFYKEPSLDDYLYPEWAKSLGWLIAMFPIMLMVVFFLGNFCLGGGYQLMVSLMKPTKDWGPALMDNKKTYNAQLGEDTYQEKYLYVRRNNIAIVLNASRAPTPCPGTPVMGNRTPTYKGSRLLTRSALHLRNDALLDIQHERNRQLSGSLPRLTVNGSQTNLDTLPQRMTESAVDVHAIHVRPQTLNIRDKTSPERAGGESSV